MRYTNIIFDFDGTLNQTAPAILAATRAMMEEMGIPDRPEAEMMKLVGPLLKDGFSNILGIPPEKIEQAVSIYREKAKTVGIDLVKPFPGILELLGRLKQAGCTLGLVTARVRSTALVQVERYGFAPYLDFVYGAHEDGSGTKDVLLKEVCQIYALDKASTVMVGDRFYDLEGAHGAGLPCIAVLYGYGSLEELAACNPEYTVATVAELGQLLFG